MADVAVVETLRQIIIIAAKAIPFTKTLLNLALCVRRWMADSVALFFDFSYNAKNCSNFWLYSVSGFCNSARMASSHIRNINPIASASNPWLKTHAPYTFAHTSYSSALAFHHAIYCVHAPSIEWELHTAANSIRIPRSFREWLQNELNVS